MISIKEAEKSYGTFKALRSLNLQVKQGEIYGLLGPNGAGKSTTINMLLGFLKADAGEVNVCGFNPALQTKEVRKLAGYIPESVVLYEHLTAVENLWYFCSIAGISISSARIQEILTTCGLPVEAHHKRLGAFSKGMRQKVAIAIAYAKNAQVLLLDEPASGLDPLASVELGELLKNLAARGTTILMASHDLFRTRETCHRVGILKNGELLKEFYTADISSQELENIYINYMQQ